MSNTNFKENMPEVGTCVYHSSYTPKDYFGVVTKVNSNTFAVSWFVPQTGNIISSSTYGPGAHNPINCILWGEDKPNKIFDWEMVERQLNPNLIEFLLKQPTKTFSPQESKLIRKIRSLDTKWANSQIKKGNKPCGVLLATVN